MRNVINAGQDAVDVKGWPCDEGGLERTAKACGPGIATLMSNPRFLEPRAMVAKKPVHQGEHAISRKAIVCGDAG